MNWMQTLVACGLVLVSMEFVQAESPWETTRPETMRPANVRVTGTTEIDIDTDISHVKLDATGLLRGIVINLQGVPIANTTVAIRKADGQVVRAATDAFGCFAVDGLPE
ncbi:MAG TPA: carboxypeptidase-like regulatory domain-containing protein, partial [Thermoguttaceae bacterium]|nr:carboxypeptidase-like regulatory domain-containing protein [Thermoguttaceae bacterium]